MIPLPPWLNQGQNVKLNFPSGLKNNISEKEYSLLQEPRAREFYKPKGRSPFSADIIHYALHLRYTSLKSYKLSLLNKNEERGVDAMTGFFKKKNRISKDCVVMIDEMYLQRGTQYQRENMLRLRKKLS